MSLHPTPAFRNIRGADITARTKIEITPGIDYTCHWESHGFKVHIPAGAISEERGPVTLYIQASLSGDYQLPDDGVLVSGVYWLSLHPPVEKFEKEITVILQHCASDDDSTLSFVTAKCTQKSLPYTFQPVPGGSFKNRFGSIKVSHFSGLAMAGENYYYNFCTYYIRKQPNVYVADIAVIPDLTEYCSVSSTTLDYEYVAIFSYVGGA